MALAAGTPVGEYEVVRQLGAGAMGEVYEAVHPMIGKRVAIKVMRTPASEAVVEARRLLEEARVVNAIRHPAIIDIFGANVLADGRPFLVMELLEGQSLQDYLKANHPLTIADVVSLLDGLLEPLSAAHKAGVIHRDLKPTNVFVLAAGEGRRVKLLDFGIAQRADRERLTSPEITVGSLGFMGPEQLHGKASAQSDLYAVGCVAWLLLTGQPVFPYKSMGELARNHMLAVPPPVRTLRRATPAALESWVAALLQKDAARRPPDAFEALLLLRVINEELGESTALHLDEEDQKTLALPAIRHTPDLETRHVPRVAPGPAVTIDEDEDDPESTVRIIPNRPRR
jgi:eukaryotic-like serine/threonine-protein kinase